MEWNLDGANLSLNLDEMPILFRGSLLFSSPRVSELYESR